MRYCSSILSLIACWIYGLYLPSFAESVNTIPFHYAAGHIIIIPVKICGESAEAMLDTGAGVNILNRELINRLHCDEVKMHSGKRMSGQKLRMRIFRVDSTQIADSRTNNVPCADWNLNELFAGEADLSNVKAVVSLAYFKNKPFTMDYANKQLIMESDASLSSRVRDGLVVPIRINNRSGCETSIEVQLSFEGGKRAWAEVDTGSSSLILDQHYMRSFNIKTTQPEVKKIEGKDETAHPFTRYMSTLPGAVSLRNAQEISQLNPRVQFQKIIHQGLIGDSFLHNFIVTYDLPHRRLIFNKPNKLHP